MGKYTVTSKMVKIEVNLNLSSLLAVADAFDSKNLAIRAQKKLLGKMSSKKIAKIFIDDTSARLLDNVYKLVKEYTGSKKLAEKHTKDLIKTVIKVGILYRNDQFSDDEIVLAEDFKKKFRTVSMTVISYYEIDFSFDKNFLAKALNECKTMLKQLVQRHLTDKSQTRIDNVFNTFLDTALLETVFHPDSKHRPILGRIVEDLNSMLENNAL